MNIAICTRATLYNHQRLYVNQIIYNYWMRMQAGIVEKILRSGKPVNLTGDGQFDSPGFSARFLFYTMIDSTTKLVVDFYVAEKTMVSDKLILTSVARSPQARIRIRKYWYVNPEQYQNVTDPQHWFLCTQLSFFLSFCLSFFSQRPKIFSTYVYLPIHP